MSPKLKLVIYFFIAANIFLAAWTVLNGDILFHTDIARDFMLLEDIVDTHKPTLIGPRSGGIPGVFHGPMWMYMNLPAFILGQGNPVAVGWFWVLLSISLVIIIYFVAKKLFDEKVGLLSALLVSVFTITETRTLFNPFGAVMLFPLYFYFFYEYLQQQKAKLLVAALFIMGCIIQFQMAFGVPILFLSTVYLAYFLFKHKKLSHFLTFLILAIPLSTYIVFELRHNFLQLNSVLNYISGKENSGKMQGFDYVFSRLKGMFVDGWGLIPGEYWFLTLIMVFVGAHILYKKYKSNSLPEKNMYGLFFYFYFGYWLIAFLFKGVIWGYYYWPFLPMAVIMFVSFLRLVPRKLFITVFLIVFLINGAFAVRGIIGLQNFIGKDGGSWKFNYQMSRGLFEKADTEFGYYIFTPDLFGYTQRYAMNYADKQYPNKKAYPFEKKKYTYIFFAPAPSNRPWMNGEWWKENQVKITKKPVETKTYENGIRVEKYELTPEEVQIQSDPAIADLNNLYFR